MMFLFTTSNKIGARAIRWALNEPVSHFAVVFDESEDGYGIVFHSHFSGVSFDWFKHFYSQNRIVHALRPKEKTSLPTEEKIYQAVVSKMYGKDYDRTLFAEFTFYALRRKLTGKEIPRLGRYGKGDAYLCTEVARNLQAAHPAYLSQTLTGDLITPFQLYTLMKQSESLETVPWITQTLLKG